MKKCYFLCEVKLVDLYENDLCGLKKTIAVARKFTIFDTEDSAIDLESRKDEQLLQEIIKILRLKYFI